MDVKALKDVWIKRCNAIWCSIIREQEALAFCNYMLQWTSIFLRARFLQSQKNIKARTCFEWNSPKWKSALSLHHRFFKGSPPSATPHISTPGGQPTKICVLWKLMEIPWLGNGSQVASSSEIGLETFWTLDLDVTKRHADCINAFIIFHVNS